MYNGVKIKPRGINYFSDEGVAITIDVVPAQYKNIDGTCYVVSKRGYIIMKLVEYDKETEHMNFAEKQDFVIQPQNVDVILGINPHDPKLDEQGEVCFYEAPEDPVTKVFKITYDQGDFIIMHASMENEKVSHSKQIRLKRG